MTVSGSRRRCAARSNRTAFNRQPPRQRYISGPRMFDTAVPLLGERTLARPGGDEFTLLIEELQEIPATPFVSPSAFSRD